jgi:hypothetical protein
LIIPIIIIICIIGFIWFVLTPDVAKAQLIIDSGTVQIKHPGESWTSAQNGMLLYQSDSIKTGDNTSASIILFESSIIRLDNNTEITIQEILQQEGETSVKIKQESGRTWNTVLKMSGIDDYEVHTPTTVASVRGTSFDIKVIIFNIPSEDNKLKYLVDIGVGRGIVFLSRILDGQVIDSIEVDEDEAVTVDPEEIDQPLAKKPFEKDSWVLKNQNKDKEISNIDSYDWGSGTAFGMKIKKDLYDRIEEYIPELKEIYGITDEELDVLIDGYLLGYYDLPPETPEWVREIIEIA